MKLPTSLPLPIFALVVLTCPAMAADLLTQNLGAASQSPSLQRRADYRVDLRISVTPPSKTKVLKVWVPLPQSVSLADVVTGKNAAGKDLKGSAHQGSANRRSADGQVQVISDRKLSTFPRGVEPTIHTEPKFGNQFAYFEFENPQGAQLITHQFQASIWETRWDVDFSDVEIRSSWPESMSVYQRLDPRLAQSAPADQTVRRVLQGSQGRSAPTRLLQAMRWIDGNVTYDHSVASLSADPTHAVLEGRGHCSDYHGLCNAFAQAVGFPSRVCYGLQMFDKASPSHCKLEVFLPPYGWVLFDLSETQKLVKKIQAKESLTQKERASLVAKIRDRTRQGFRENTWLKVTAGSHYDLVPAAAAGPVNVVRTIYAEADGVPLVEPDPSNPNETKFSWMTMHRVDPIGANTEAAKKFSNVQ